MTQQMRPSGERSGAPSGFVVWAPSSTSIRASVTDIYNLSMMLPMVPLSLRASPSISSALEELQTTPRGAWMSGSQQTLVNDRVKYEMLKLPDPTEVFWIDRSRKSCVVLDREGPRISIVLRIHSQTILPSGKSKVRSC